MLEEAIEKEEVLFAHSDKSYTKRFTDKSGCLWTYSKLQTVFKKKSEFVQFTTKTDIEILSLLGSNGSIK